MHSKFENCKGGFMKDKKEKKHKYYPEEIFAAFLMMLMVGLCFINICGRYLFKTSMVVTDQLLTQIWPCVIFLAAPVCCSRHSLTCFTLVSDAFPVNKQKWFELITTIAGVISFGFLGYYGIHKCYAYFKTGYRIASLGTFPVWIFYVAIPLGSALYIVRTIQECYKAFRNSGEEGNG